MSEAEGLRIEVGSRTDVGQVRKNNEDSHRVVPAVNLFVLSDGMGGGTHGELASMIAVETIVEYCLRVRSVSSLECKNQWPDFSDQTNRLASATYLANNRIYDAALSTPVQHGMGTTVIAIWLEGFRLSLVHVGDSRAYLLRSGVLECLTSDHTLVAEQVRRGILTPQEARMSTMQSVLMRALGTEKTVELDVSERMLLCGDVLLLCTDGLTRMLHDSEIADTLLHTSHAQHAADRLVALANANGGEDNITAMVIRIHSTPCDAKA